MEIGVGLLLEISVSQKREVDVKPLQPVVFNCAFWCHDRMRLSQRWKQQKPNVTTRNAKKGFGVNEERTRSGITTTCSFSISNGRTQFTRDAEANQISKKSNSQLQAAKGKQHGKADVGSRSDDSFSNEMDAEFFLAVDQIEKQFLGEKLVQKNAVSKNRSPASSTPTSTSRTSTRRVLKDINGGTSNTISPIVTHDKSRDICKSSLTNPNRKENVGMNNNEANSKLSCKPHADLAVAPNHAFDKDITVASSSIDITDASLSLCSPLSKNQSTSENNKLQNLVPSKHVHVLIQRQMVLSNSDDIATLAASSTDVLDASNGNSVGEVNHASPSQQLQMSEWGLPDSVLYQYHKKGIVKMFPWQTECLKSSGVLKGRNLVYSAPTSAGKTLVAEILMLKRVLETRCKAIYILPFVSVSREKMFYLQTMFRDAGIRVGGYMGHHSPAGGFSRIDIAICTIEKANSLVNRLLEENRMEQLGIVVVDELHMIGDSHRGYLLELLLTKIRFYDVKRNCKSSIQIVGMSATLPNLDLLSRWLDAALYKTNYRPVPLTECIKIGLTVYDSAMQKLRDICLNNKLKGDDDHIIPLCMETITAGHSILIFCPTKNWCEKLANTIAGKFYNLLYQHFIKNQGAGADNEDEQTPIVLNQKGLRDVTEQLKRSPTGLDPVLKKTVEYGVAYHHAGLTFEERDIIEGAYRTGSIRVLVATSTLSSGVNLPARRVVVRSPVFHGGKMLDVLSYRQMIGRAGRQGVDTEGESILVCKPSEKTKALNLMSAQLEPVQSCLVMRQGESVTSSMKRAILEVIVSGVARSPEEIDKYVSCTMLAASMDCDTSIGQTNVITKCVQFLQDNEFIHFQDVDGVQRFVPSQLGCAVLASSLSPDEALYVFDELKKARRCFDLSCELHIVYQVTPTYIDAWNSIDWFHYMCLWESLPSDNKRVGILVGVDEGFLARAVRGGTNARTAYQFKLDSIHRRFYAALVLNDLINEMPLADVAKKYKTTKGVLQSMQQSSATFAGMVTAFCNRLGWQNMELLFHQFQRRLTFGIHQELCDLVRISLLNAQRARNLYNGGYKTVAMVANADPSDIENVLRNSAPFESSKKTSGESEYEVAERKETRCIWVTGRKGLTEREAAEMITKEAIEIIKEDIEILGFQCQPVVEKREYPSDNEISDDASCSRLKRNTEPETSQQPSVCKDANQIHSSQKQTNCETENRKIDISSLTDSTRKENDRLPNPVEGVNLLQQSVEATKLLKAKNGIASDKLVVTDSASLMNICQLIPDELTIQTSRAIFSKNRVTAYKIDNTFEEGQHKRKHDQNKDERCSRASISSNQHSLSTAKENVGFSATISNISATVGLNCAIVDSGSESLFDCSDKLVLKLSENNSPLLRENVEENKLISRKVEKKEACLSASSTKNRESIFDNRLIDKGEEDVNKSDKSINISDSQNNDLFSESLFSKCHQDGENASHETKSILSNSLTNTQINQLACALNSSFETPKFDKQACNGRRESDEMDNSPLMSETAIAALGISYERNSSYIAVQPDKELQIKTVPSKPVSKVISQEFIANTNRIWQNKNAHLFFEKKSETANAPCDNNNKRTSSEATSMNLSAGTVAILDMLAATNPNMNCSSPKNSPSYAKNELLKRKSDGSSGESPPRKFGMSPDICRSTNNLANSSSDSDVIQGSQNHADSPVSKVGWTPLRSLRAFQSLKLSPSFHNLQPSSAVMQETADSGNTRCARITRSKTRCGKGMQLKDKQLIKKQGKKKLAFTESSAIGERSVMCLDGSLKVIDVMSDECSFRNFVKQWKSKSLYAFGVVCEKCLEYTSIGPRSTGRVKKQPNKDTLKVPGTESRLMGVTVCWDKAVNFISFESSSEQEEVGDSASSTGCSIPLSKCLKAIKSVLEMSHLESGEEVVKVILDCKVQVTILAMTCGILPKGKMQDPKVAAWLLDPCKHNNLLALAIDFIPLESAIIQGLKKRTNLDPPESNFSNLSSAVLYNSIESAATLLVMQKMTKLLEQNGLFSIFVQVEMPCRIILAKMELNGLGFSQEECKTAANIMKNRQAALEQAALKLAGRQFSLTSVDDVAKILYLELKLHLKDDDTKEPSALGATRKLRYPCQQKRKRKLPKEFSTTKQSLERLKHLHPLPGIILEWRKIQTALARVVYPLQCSAEHSSFLHMDRIHGKCETCTATGRITMHEPNLQSVHRDFEITEVIQQYHSSNDGKASSRNNIKMPVSSYTGHDEKRECTVSIRHAFIAFQDGVLLAADYSQLELRIISHLSKDSKLIAILNSGGDVFRMIASKWKSISVSSVTDVQRQQAKHMCYGMIYGIGPKALSEQLGVKENDAAVFIENFKSKYTGMRSYLMATVEECTRDGYVTTLSNRRRYLPNIRHTNPTLRSQAERQAINTTVQGSAADLVKIAMVNIEDRLNREFPSTMPHKMREAACTLHHIQCSGAYLVLHLHDELIYEVKYAHLHKVAHIVKTEMEEAMQLAVSLPVNVRVGKNWGALKEFKL